MKKTLRYSLNKIKKSITGKLFLGISIVFFHNLFAQTANGNETLVYDHNDSQQSAKVASDDAGNYVVVWVARNKDGEGKGIYGQLYDYNANPIGTEFLVNTTTANDQMNPAVAMDSDGDFVVTWTSNLQDGDVQGIYAQRYNSSGVTQGAEFRVNTNTNDIQDYSAIAIDNVGNFTIVWHSMHTGNFDIFAQQYDKTGQTINGEILIPSTTANAQSTPSIAMDNDGDFVVSWNSVDDVHARRFAADGTPKDLEFRVNTYLTDDQSNSSVGMDANGNFIIVWQSFEQDGDLYGIYGQRFDYQGNAVGTEFHINDEITDTQNSPSVAMNSVGEFIVTWISEGQDGSGKGIFAKEFSINGVQSSTEFLVNTTTFNDQIFPSVATSLRGNFIIAWNTFASIYLQRYTSLLQSTNKAISSLEFTLHPNPSSSLVHFNVEGPLEIRVLDLQGKLQLEETITSGVLDVGNLKPGVYQVEVTNGKSNGIEKLIVE